MIFSRISRLILNRPGSVSIVFNGCRNDVKIGVFDVDIEEVSAGGFWFSVRVDSVNGKVLWFGVLEATGFETGSFSIGFPRGCHLGILINVDFINRVCDLFSVESDIDQEGSRVGWEVGDIEGSVVVVSDLGGFGFSQWVSDHDFEGEAADWDEVSENVSGFDFEGGWFVCFSTFQTRTKTSAF